MIAAIFVDKDGTIIPDIPYNVNPDLITLYEGVKPSLTRLKELGFLIFIVSNQAGIAKGFFTEDDFVKVKEKIEALLNTDGKVLDGFYYCPHAIDGKIGEYTAACKCRKPLPGMLLQAAADHAIDLSASWMIGDILNDVEAGNRAGCKSVLINNGNETEWHFGAERTPLFEAADFKEAAEYIIKQITHE